MSQSGVVRLGTGESLRPRDTLTAKSWLELESGARVMIKHTETGREWTLEGPALAAFCPEGREEVVLGRGKLRTELGAGARPGGEVTVGTPFGRVSYGDARLELQVSERELRLRSLAGDAWLSPAGAKAEADVRVAGGGSTSRSRGQKAADAVALCAAAAKHAGELAAAVTSPAGSGPGLGQRAAEHMRARKSARSRCANAAAAVIGELRGTERESRLAELAQHEQAWERVPGGVQPGR